MAYRTVEWNIVSSNKLEKKKTLKKDVRLQWKSFEYIGKTKDTGNRIVLYEWRLLWEPNELWLVEVEYLDRNIKINPDKILVKRELPIKFLTIL